jgi:hypothetical protein
MPHRQKWIAKAAGISGKHSSDPYSAWSPKIVPMDKVWRMMNLLLTERLMSLPSNA